MKKRLTLLGPIAVLALAGCGSSSSSTTSSTATNAAATTPTATTAAFLTPLRTASMIASTVPGNGDVNPYGLALVPATVGKLKMGNLLVSNFNDKANNQGTGTTIVQITPAGAQSLFATISASSLPGSCPGASGSRPP